MEYKIGDRVEATHDTEYWFEAEYRGMVITGVGEYAKPMVLPKNSHIPYAVKGIRPLPTPPPPFKVGDVVEVDRLDGGWSR